MATAFAVVVIIHRNASASGSTGSALAASVPAPDTSGSYGVLVARANGLYDQGSKAAQSNNANAQTLSSEYFAAAATVYAAAWRQQPGDPAVGTDYATSLFYSGDVAKAIKQVSKVLAKDPTYQNALYNKGIYVATQARTDKQSGETAQATRLFAEAKRLFDAAVKIDPSSPSGQDAAKQAAIVAQGQ